MKSLKYSLFLSVASACMFSSSLVAPQLPSMSAPVNLPTFKLDPAQHDASVLASGLLPAATVQQQAPLAAPQVQVPVTAPQLLVPAQHDASALVTPAPQVQVGVPVVNAGGQLLQANPTTPVVLDPTHAAPQLPVLAPVTTPQAQVGVPVVNAGGQLLQVNPTTPVVLDPTQHAGQQVQVGVPMAPSEAEKNKEAEAQAVKDIVDGVPDKRAEALVAALVANKLTEDATAVVNPTVVTVEAAAPLAPAKKAKPALTKKQADDLASARAAQAAGATEAELTPDQVAALQALKVLKDEKVRLRAEAAASPASVPAAPVAKVKKTKADGLSDESTAALKAAKLAKKQNAPLTQEQTDALVKAQAEIAALQASKQQPVAAPVESELLPVDLFDVPAPAAQHEVPGLSPSSIPAVESQLPAAVAAPTPVVAAPLAPAPVLATLDAAPNGVTIDAKLVMNGKGEVVVTTTSSLNPPSTTPLAIGPAVGVTDKPTGVEKPATVDINAKKVEEKPAAVTVKDDAAGKKVEEKPAGDANKDAAGNIEAPKTAEVAAVK